MSTGEADLYTDRIADFCGAADELLLLKNEKRPLDSYYKAAPSLLGEARAALWQTIFDAFIEGSPPRL